MAPRSMALGQVNSFHAYLCFDTGMSPASIPIAPIEGDGGGGGGGVAAVSVGVGVAGVGVGVVGVRGDGVGRGDPDT